MQVILPMSQKPTAVGLLTRNDFCFARHSLTVARTVDADSFVEWCPDSLRGECFHLFSSRVQFSTTCSDAGPFWSADFIIRNRRPSVS
jgi:hypothetical protein